MWLFQLVLLLHDVSSKEIRVIFKRDMLEGGISVDFEVSLWMIIHARSGIHYIPEESYFFFFCFFFFLIVRRESKWNIRFYCWMGDGDDEGCPSLNSLFWLPSVFKSKKLCVCVCVCVVLCYKRWCWWLSQSGASETRSFHYINPPFCCTTSSASSLAAAGGLLGWQSRDIWSKRTSSTTGGVCVLVQTDV